MIISAKAPLHALYAYYLRKVNENDNITMPTQGLDWVEISFAIVLDDSGNFYQLLDCRNEKKSGMCVIAPQPVKRSSGIEANLLWDNLAYVLGYSSKKDDKKAILKNKEFIKKIEEYFPDASADKGVSAVLMFLKKQNFSALYSDSGWPDMSESSGNISFKLVDGSGFIFENQSVRDSLKQFKFLDISAQGQCLVTGEYTSLARLHPSIKGVWGGQSSGANIVSFNLPAFNSYAKEQSMNAPISEAVADGYTKALNTLLRKGSKQRVQIGDSSVVFWAEKNSEEIEDIFGGIFGTTNTQNEGGRIEYIKELYKKPFTGARHITEDNTPFYVLGLAPNAARIAIRFWYVATVGELAVNILRYFEDIELPVFEKKLFPTLGSLCASLVMGGDIKRLPNNFQAILFYAIIQGRKYPPLFFNLALERIRATRQITSHRVAILKAYLIRNFDCGVSMTIDKNNRQIGYLLGQLFFVYDKLKEDESDKRTNRRDAFFAAFSTRPLTVFARMNNLAGFDQKKLYRSKQTRGIAISASNKISKIISLIGKPETNIPLQLSIEQQAWFVLGYYHQREEPSTSNKEKESIDEIAT